MEPYFQPQVTPQITVGCVCSAVRQSKEAHLTLPGTLFDTHLLSFAIIHFSIPNIAYRVPNGPSFPAQPHCQPLTSASCQASLFPWLSFQAFSSVGGPFFLCRNLSGYLYHTARPLCLPHPWDYICISAVFYFPTRLTPVSTGTEFSV